VFVPGKRFHPSLMFAGKAGVNQSQAPFRFPLLGRLRALLANIRLGWISFPWTNSPAYYEYFINYEIITLGPGFLKLFTTIIYYFCNKLEYVFDKPIHPNLMLVVPIIEWSLLKGASLG
jgi:hypothetical protein